MVAKCDHLVSLKYSKALPNVFTEHGAIMAASVLNSHRAVEVSVFVVRAFVALRQMLSGQKELAAKLEQLEQRLTDHDEKILVLIQAIRRLTTYEPVPRKRRIEFSDDE